MLVMIERSRHQKPACRITSQIRKSPEAEESCWCILDEYSYSCLNVLREDIIPDEKERCGVRQVMMGKLRYWDLPELSSRPERSRLW